MIAPRLDASSTDADGRVPPLAPALAAMTATQALVALALFAPGVLAPRLGLTVQDVSLFAICVFAVGMATSFAGGRLADRFGSCRVAAACAIAVALGMACATHPSAAMLIASGVLIGLAFGPETPASSKLLGRLARPAQRPLIFSVRQTGNQIGAIVGSLSLPLIARDAPRLGYVLIALIAVAAAAALMTLSSRYDGAVSAAPAAARTSLLATARTFDRRLLSLALLSIPFSAMQLALNAYLVTHAVTALALGHVAAGIMLAVAQTGGLAGRLFWGLVATRWLPPVAVLAALGIGMSASALTLALAAPGLPVAAMLLLAFVLGLTASGWNGVFLAEVARLSQPDRVAETTGTVLTASYAGLLSAPMLIAWASPTGKLQASFASIAILALAATAVMMWSNREPAERV